MTGLQQVDTPASCTSSCTAQRMEDVEEEEVVDEDVEEDDVEVEDEDVEVKDKDEEEDKD